MNKKILVFLSTILFLFGACSSKADEQYEKNKVPLEQLKLCQQIKDQQLKVNCIESVDGTAYHNPYDYP